VFYVDHLTGDQQKYVEFVDTLPNNFAVLVHFLYFVWGPKQPTGGAICRLIVLHPNQNIERKIKLQILYFYNASKCCLYVKGLKCIDFTNWSLVEGEPRNLFTIALNLCCGMSIFIESLYIGTHLVHDEQDVCV